MRAVSNSNVNPMRQASTSPTNQEPWRRAPPQQESSALRHQVVGMDSPYRRSSQDTYSASTSNRAEMQTTNSPNSSILSTSSQGPYGIQQPTPAMEFPDLISPMLRLLQTQYCSQALEVMDHMMTMSETPMRKQHMRMSFVGSG